MSSTVGTRSKRALVPRRGWFRRLQQRAGKPGFFSFLALLAFIDYLTVFVPIDAFLISAVLVRPAKWLRISLVMALASTAGGLLIAALFAWSPHFVSEYIGTGRGSEVWVVVKGFFASYGAYAVAVSAIVPIPQHPTLVIATLGGLPFPKLALAFLIGRLIKFLTLGYLAAESPDWLVKLLPGLERKLRSIGYEFKK